MTRERALFISFGLGGHHIDYGTEKTETGSVSSSTSGYCSPRHFETAEKTAANSSGHFPDGTPALNKIPALETDEGISYAIAGPMVNVNLPPGECERLGDTKNSIVANAVASQPGNAYGALINLHRQSKGRQEYGPLDYVALDIYIARWLELGAIYGEFKDGAIVWQYPEPEPEIPAPEQTTLEV